MLDHLAVYVIGAAALYFAIKAVLFLTLPPVAPHRDDFKDPQGPNMTPEEYRRLIDGG